MKCADLYSAFQALISMANFRCVCDTLYNFDFSLIHLVCQVSIFVLDFKRYLF